MLVHTTISILICVVPFAAGFAQGAHAICTNSPRSHWMSWQEIETKLIDQGQRMVRLRIATDRCLTVLAVDSKGDYREMRMDPVSGRILHSEAVHEPRSTGILPWRVRNPGL